MLAAERVAGEEDHRREQHEVEHLGLEVEEVRVDVGVREPHDRADKHADLVEKRAAREVGRT